MTHQPSTVLLLQTDCVPVHWASSDQSPQSFSPSHFHHVGMQRPFLHSYWKYLEQPGTSVGAAATHATKVSIRYCCFSVMVPPHISNPNKRHVVCICYIFNTCIQCIPHGLTINTSCAVGPFLLTTVGLIGVIPTVVHAITLPLQAHTHSVGTLEGVGITHFPKLRWRGWQKNTQARLGGSTNQFLSLCMTQKENEYVCYTEVLKQEVAIPDGYVWMNSWWAFAEQDTNLCFKYVGKH